MKLQKTALKHVDEEIISITRGVVEVTVDEDGCQTVVKTGFRYPAHVDFADGRYDQKGDFVPRYWGWGGRGLDKHRAKVFDGVILDSHTGRDVSPLNPLPSATILLLPRTPHDRMEEIRHRAELIKMGLGVD